MVQSNGRTSYALYLAYKERYERYLEFNQWALQFVWQTGYLGRFVVMRILHISNLLFHNFFSFFKWLKYIYTSGANLVVKRDIFNGNYNNQICVKIYCFSNRKKKKEQGGDVPALRWTLMFSQNLKKVTGHLYSLIQQIINPIASKILVQINRKFEKYMV